MRPASWRLPKWLGSGFGFISLTSRIRDRDRHVQALELDSGYAKEVADIMGMRGITDAERAAGLKSLKEKYEKARGDLSERIDRIEQTAEDLAFAYGGKASDYYKDLDDSEPKYGVDGAFRSLKSLAFKDEFLLALRRNRGGPCAAPSDSHVLNAALQVAMSVVGGEGSSVEKRLTLPGRARSRKPQLRPEN